MASIHGWTLSSLCPAEVTAGSRVILSQASEKKGQHSGLFICSHGLCFHEEQMWKICSLGKGIELSQQHLCLFHFIWHFALILGSFLLFCVSMSIVSMILLTFGRQPLWALCLCQCRLLLISCKPLCHAYKVARKEDPRKEDPGADAALEPGGKMKWKLSQITISKKKNTRKQKQKADQTR